MGTLLDAVKSEWSDRNRLLFLAGAAAVTVTAALLSGSLQWLFLLAFFALSLLAAPRAKDSTEFFKGAKRESDLGVIVIAASVLVSWIFAKSVVNVANLGYAYGVPGALAYATYWGSFFVAGIAIYLLRTRGGFRSIPEFLATKYGRAATFAFIGAILFRLFNEVWSNVSVVAGYFGDFGTWGYITALVLVNALIVYYVGRGGMRASITTDLVQFALFAFLLIFTLGLVLPRSGGITPLLSEGTWALNAGVDLILVAFLQILSYPFHDPVMTDRGFLQKPKAMLASFTLAGVAGILVIFAFGFIGIHGRGIIGDAAGDAARTVAATFGLTVLIVMNGIMVSSAVSTVDSTYTSVSKIFGRDLPRVALGAREKLEIRPAPAGLAILGFLGMAVGVVVGAWSLAAFGAAAWLAGGAWIARKRTAIVTGAPAVFLGLWGIVMGAMLPWVVMAAGLLIVTAALIVLERDSGDRLNHPAIIRALAGSADHDVAVARVAILGAALVGNLPLFFNPSLLAATTVSGTMVLGLAPIFLLGWIRSAGCYAFHASFWSGVGAGALLLAVQQSWVPVEASAWVHDTLAIGTGKYGLLLGVNLAGLAFSTVAFALGTGIDAMLAAAETDAGAREARG